jgi:hypothetical protein
MNLMEGRQATALRDSRPHSGIGETMNRRPFRFEYGRMSETIDLDSPVCIAIPGQAIAGITPVNPAAWFQSRIDREHLMAVGKSLFNYRLVSVFRSATSWVCFG